MGSETVYLLLTVKRQTHVMTLGRHRLRRQAAGGWRLTLAGVSLAVSESDQRCLSWEELGTHSQKFCMGQTDKGQWHWCLLKGHVPSRMQAHVQTQIDGCARTRAGGRGVLGWDMLEGFLKVAKTNKSNFPFAALLPSNTRGLLVFVSLKTTLQRSARHTNESVSPIVLIRPTAGRKK